MIKLENAILDLKLDNGVQVRVGVPAVGAPVLLRWFKWGHEVTQLDIHNVMDFALRAQDELNRVDLTECSTCLGTKEFKTECCSALVCGECDDKCPICGTPIFTAPAGVK